MAKPNDIIALLVFLITIGQKGSALYKNPIVASIEALCESSKPECRVDVKRMLSRHPLLTDPRDHTKFVYPRPGSGDVRLAQRGEIHLACSGPDNRLVEIPWKQYVTAVCLCDDWFFIDDAYQRRFDDLLCERTPEYEIVPAADGKSEQLYKVGFRTDFGGNFLQLMEIHRNGKKQTTSFVKSSVPRVRAFRSFKHVNDDGTPLKFSPAFVRIDGPKSLDSFYYLPAQRSSFQAEFPKNVYIDSDRDLVLSRGHLTAAADMVYAAAARATYVYLNTHPQWYIVNRSNWNKIEEYARKLAASLGRELTAYTGTSAEQLKLRDAETAVDKAVYLNVYEDKALDKKGKAKKRVVQKNLPVPLYTYKIVVDPQTKSGVVFVTVNNPYLRDDKLDEHKFCEKIMSIPAAAGVSSDVNSKTGHVHGYSYMCEVTSFLDKTGLRYLFPVEVLSVRRLLIDNKK